MSNAKMTKTFFFRIIEERLKELTEEVEKIKADTERSQEQRIAKKNIIFGRVLELYRMNAAAMNIDYWKYTELDEKIRKLQDKI